MGLNAYRIKGFRGGIGSVAFSIGVDRGAGSVYTVDGDVLCDKSSDTIGNDLGGIGGRRGSAYRDVTSNIERRSRGNRKKSFVFDDDVTQGEGVVGEVGCGDEGLDGS